MFPDSGNRQRSSPWMMNHGAKIGRYLTTPFTLCVRSIGRGTIGFVRLKMVSPIGWSSKGESFLCLTRSATRVPNRVEFGVPFCRAAQGYKLNFLISRNYKIHTKIPSFLKFGKNGKTKKVWSIANPERPHLPTPLPPRPTLSIRNFPFCRNFKKVSTLY